MTVRDQLNAPGARRFCPQTLLAALAGGAVVAVVAAALWLKWGGIPPVPTELAAGAEAADDPASADPASTGELSANALRTEVKFASERMVQSLGIELVPVASQPVSGTIACSGRVAFNQNHYVELRARTDGIMHRIGCDVGAAVQARQTLAVINSPRVSDLKAAYINAVSQSQQLQYDATRLESLAADQAVAGKNLKEAQTALAQQRITTANARQQLVNLGFAPIRSTRWSSIRTPAPSCRWKLPGRAASSRAMPSRALWSNTTPPCSPWPT